MEEGYTHKRYFDAQNVFCLSFHEHPYRLQINENDWNRKRVLCSNFVVNVLSENMLCILFGIFRIQLYHDHLFISKEYFQLYLFQLTRGRYVSTDVWYKYLTKYNVKSLWNVKRQFSQSYFAVTMVIEFFFRYVVNKVNSIY